MDRPIVKAARRAETGKGPNRRLRAHGQIPAVVYSAGNESISLAVAPTTIAAVLGGDRGKNTVIDLAVEGEDASRMVLIKEYQIHPWKRSLIHVDFWEITPETVLTLAVPFARTGHAAAERLGVRVEQTCRTIKVHCLSHQIPAALTFDVGALPHEDANIKVSQVPMPEGVTAVYKNDFNVLRLRVPRAAAEGEGEGEGEGKSESEGKPEAAS